MVFADAGEHSARKGYRAIKKIGPSAWERPFFIKQAAQVSRAQSLN
jgi:hypothetical protein